MDETMVMKCSRHENPAGGCRGRGWKRTNQVYRAGCCRRAISLPLVQERRRLVMVGAKTNMAPSWSRNRSVVKAAAEIGNVSCHGNPICLAAAAIDEDRI
jgi:hypothetical protein